MKRYVVRVYQGVKKVGDGAIFVICVFIDLLQNATDVGSEIEVDAFGGIG